MLMNDVVKVLEEDTKFLKLLEVLGEYSDQGSIIIFVDKQEHADGLLKVVIILVDLNGETTIGINQIN